MSGKIGSWAMVAVALLAPTAKEGRGANRRALPRPRLLRWKQGLREACMLAVEVFYSCGFARVNGKVV